MPPAPILLTASSQPAGIAVKHLKKMLPNCAQNHAQTVPGASCRALGCVLAARRSPGGLLERFLEPLGASWKPLGTLLKSLGALLEAIRSQIGSNIAALGVQRLPKLSPTGSRIKIRNPVDLKVAKSQNLHTVRRI